jgi:arylsulfatase A
MTASFRWFGLPLLLVVMQWLPPLQLRSSVAADSPNVLIVLADDLGIGDLSATNPDSKISTPNLDRLAKAGMTLTDAHSSSSVCTPTRYSLLTGRYHWRTHLQSGVLGGFSRPLIAPDRLTLGKLLQQHGYWTACIGKWHLGMDWPLNDGGIADDGGNFSQPYSEADQISYGMPIANGPIDCGFNHFYGISASLDMFPYVWIQDRHATENPTVIKSFHRPGPAGKMFEAIDVQPGVTDQAIAVINQRAEAARAGQPFFIYLALAAPHTPILPTPQWQGKSGINAYADFVQQIDADMGRLMDTLEQQGLSHNTLVIFTSDNGCSPAADIDQLVASGHQPSHIYRGHKADIFEGGHRVPFIVQWKARVKAGSMSNQLIGQFDLIATLAELLGDNLPPDAGEDSVSFLPVLLDEAHDPIRTSLISQSINGSFAIRDGPWKLALCPGSGGWSFPRPGRDLPANLPEFQLYDLSVDPAETTNLLSQFPERAQAMIETLKSAIARGRSTPGPEQKNDVAIQLIKN